MKKSDLVKILSVIVFVVIFSCACKANADVPQIISAAEASETQTEAENIVKIDTPVITAYANPQGAALSNPAKKDASTVSKKAEVDYTSKIVGYKYCTGSSVNVRSDASTAAGILGTLNQNDKVGYISVNGEWVNVVYNKQSAYVKADYLTDDADWQKKLVTNNGYGDGTPVKLNSAWTYAGNSKINSGNAVMYVAKQNRNGIVVGINAGHGTKGGGSVKTLCHPDGTPKLTGGSTAAGATSAAAVSAGMTFNDGASEAGVTLKVARLVRDMLLAKGYDVLMIRDGDDVQLDNVARTVICNNAANCHVAIHFDGDGLGYDKGCFFMSVPDGLKSMSPVSKTWQASEALGSCLISGLKDNGNKIFGDGTMDTDLTQTSYSTVASVDIELGNQCSDHSDAALNRLAAGVAAGVSKYFGK